MIRCRFKQVFYRSAALITANTALSFQHRASMFEKQKTTNNYRLEILCTSRAQQLDRIR